MSLKCTWCGAEMQRQGAFPEWLRECTMEECEIDKYICCSKSCLDTYHRVMSVTGKIARFLYTKVFCGLKRDILEDGKTALLEAEKEAEELLKQFEI